HVVEVLNPFTRTEINSKAGRIALLLEEPGVTQGFLGSSSCELAVDSRVHPALAVGKEPSKVEVLHLGGKLCGEASGVALADRGHPALAGQLGVKHFLDTVAKRGDGSHPGDDNSLAHGGIPTIGE